MDYTVQQLKDILAEACAEATTAAELYFQTELNGQDQWACGFAWVNIHGIRGNTRLGRKLKEAGIGQDYTRAFQIWNPSGHNAQNVDTKHAGAQAAARVFEKYGFRAYAGSRLD